MDVNGHVSGAYLHSIKQHWRAQQWVCETPLGSYCEHLSPLAINPSYSSYS